VIDWSEFGVIDRSARGGFEDPSVLVTVDRGVDLVVVVVGRQRVS